MTQLSASQLETIRTRPQRTDLSLSIFQPQAIFKARINDGSIAQGAMVIAYNTVSLGAYTAIEANFTMWVGTTEGGRELGKIRVRSATASTITVSENSDVNWQNGAYLTVYKYVELWPIFPRIIQDPSNIENTLWYKDYDIAYTNQNSILGTYICMGPNRAGMVDPASNNIQFYYTATGTYSLTGDTLNYQWTFEGGSPASSTALTPGNVTYPTAGNYITRLSVSGSNGAIDTSYRTVRVHSPADPPVQKWQLTSLSGSRDQGGYTATFKVFSIIPIQEYAVVVLYADNWYGPTRQSFGGQPNTSNIFWVGYVEKDSIQYDYEHSEMTFTASSITLMMRKSSSFAISVGTSAAPAYWYELLDMDSRRGLYHYLRWHSTALNIADFQFMGQDAKTQFFDTDRVSMYDAIDNWMRVALDGKVVSDRQGKVWMEVNAEAYNNPTGSFPASMSITKRDWINTPSIEERLTNDLAFVEVGGVAYSGVVTGTYNAILSNAPGITPGFRGNVESPIEGLTLINQSQLNQLAGNIFANRNTPFPTIDIEMANNFANIDIAPQETGQIDIARTDTVRNLAVNGLYLPNDMSWTYVPQDQLLLPKIAYRQLVSGIAGQPITIPPAEDQGNGGFNVPGLQIPALPPLVVPTWSVPTGTIQAIVNSMSVLQDYGYYAYQAFTGVPISEFRGMIYDSSSINTSGAGYIKFQVATSGVYYIVGQLSVQGPPDSISLILDHSALAGDLRYTAIAASPYNWSKDMTISNIFNLTGGGWVSFTWSSSGGWTTTSFASLNVFRFSA